MFLKIFFKSSLHIRTSGESNSEANYKRPDYILASWSTLSLTSSFVALALKVVLFTRIKRCANVYTNKKWFGSHTSMHMWMLVRIRKRFIRIATATCECLCKWRGESLTQMCEWGIRVYINFHDIFWKKFSKHFSKPFLIFSIFSEMVLLENVGNIPKLFEINFKNIDDITFKIVWNSSSNSSQ